MSATPPAILRALVALAVFSVFGASFAHAQKQPNNEFGFWGSISSNSPDVYGSRGHVRFGALAFRYGRAIRNGPILRIEYTLDIEPMEIIHEHTYIQCTFFQNGVEKTGYCPQGYQTVYGGGISPFGWKFNWLPRRSWEPLTAFGGGFVASKTAVPIDIPLATRFNFTFELQVGVEHYNAKRSRALTFAYKLQHISNASRTNVNPGVDLNVFSLGYSFFR